MKALVFQATLQPLVYQDMPEPEPQKGEVLVRLEAAALNRRDYWISVGQYPGLKAGVILGSDGAGWWNDQRVLINPNIDWGPEEKAQDRAYQVLGMPQNGTFAPRISVPEDRIHPIPEHLTFQEAAALPLSAMTAYRALFIKGQAEPGQKVLITGAGGGVALFAVQFAVAAGLEVYVTTGEDFKLKQAIDLGAQGGVNYRTADWPKALGTLAGMFDLIIDSAGGAAFNELVKLAQWGGRIVLYGGTLGALEKISPQLIFWRQLTLCGSTMASDKEFVEMLSFVNQHRIKPVISKVYPLSDGNSALQDMGNNHQFGKLVLEVNS